MVAHAELRQHPRFRVQLGVDVRLPSGPQKSKTQGISLEGLSLSLAPRPAIDEVAELSIALPDGRVVAATGRCRGHMPGGTCGFHLHFEPAERSVWHGFLEEEQASGALWRMIGRIAAAPDNPLAPREIVDPGPVGEAPRRFHTVGESGAAYRIAFAKHPSDAPEDSGLGECSPAFAAAARQVRRVLRETLTLRFEDGDRGAVVRARVVELLRGGWAFVQGDERSAVGFGALGVGETVLIEEGGMPVFPFFDGAELEQIALDAVRPSAVAVALPAGADERLRSSSAPPEGARRFVEGLDAVRFAQAATEGAKRRRYGDRDIFLHPAVWAKVELDDGSALVGPTLQDAARVCVLALVGQGTPRVVRLTRDSRVVLVPPPRA